MNDISGFDEVFAIAIAITIGLLMLGPIVIAFSDIYRDRKKRKK